MVRLGRIARDYAEAGSVNTLLALWGFVDDGTFLTKSGHVALAFRLDGISFEGLALHQQREVVHRMEAALRLLDERCRLYQYLLKATVPPFDAVPCRQPTAHDAVQRRAAYLNERRRHDGLYDISLYCVLVYEPSIKTWRSNSARTRRLNGRFLIDALSTQRTVALLEADLARALAVLHQKAQAFQVQLGDLGLVRLDKRDAFQFLRLIINLDPERAAAASLTHDAHLDYFLADCGVDCHRDHLVVGNRFVKLLAMREPPSQTFALQLRDLIAVPGEFVACLEWQRIPSDRMRRDIQTRRRHFFNRRISVVNYVSPDTHPDEMLVDDSASATVHQLGDAATELEVNGHFFGQCSMTLVLHGHSRAALDTQAAEAMKVMAIHDGSFVPETYNLLNAWLATVPGNGAYNLRRLALLETNVADLSFLFTLDPGSRISPHLGGDALTVFETPHGVPYGFNLHVEDVGHTLVLGATGSGKSFLVNFLITQAQKYEPATVVLDIGGSYRKLARLLGGGCLRVGLTDTDVAINPFALAPTPEHLHFLHGFVRVLLEGVDSYRLSDAEDRETYDAIENVYVLDRAQRRLFTLANMLPRALGQRLHKWIEGGRYGRLFDNVDDTLSFQQLQVFDFESMAAYPELVEPLVFYLLHRISQRVHAAGTGSTLKLCVMDEAWRFIQHASFRAYVQEGLKTWRKQNAAMVLATQSVADFASADLLRTVVEGCPTKLFLANPALSRSQYAELFQLNEAELDLLAHLVPRQDLLLKRPGVTRVLTLTVDPQSYWIYTNTPTDNERVEASTRRDAVTAVLDGLVPTA